jgi:hypothetical protein
MNYVGKIINPNEEVIPVEHHDKTYQYFSFDVYNDKPIFLVMATNLETPDVIIRDLDRLTDEGLQRVTDFLKTIKIDDSAKQFHVNLDVVMAKETFGVDIPIGKE